MQAKSIATEVYDSFHELFLYEAIEQLILNHERKHAQEKFDHSHLDAQGREHPVAVGHHPLGGMVRPRMPAHQPAEWPRRRRGRHRGRQCQHPEALIIL